MPMSAWTFSLSSHIIKYSFPWYKNLVSEAMWKCETCKNKAGREIREREWQVPVHWVHIKCTFLSYVRNSVSWDWSDCTNLLLAREKHLCSSLRLRIKNTKKYNLTSRCLLRESSQLFYSVFLTMWSIQVSEICHFLSLTNRANSHHLVLCYNILNG